MRWQVQQLVLCNWIKEAFLILSEPVVTTNYGIEKGNSMFGIKKRMESGVLMAKKVFPRQNRSRLIFIVGLIIVGMVARLFPYPPNFSPIGAIALFAGATLGAKFRAALIPLTAMLLSDYWLGMHALMPVVYACFLFNVWLGSRIQSNPKPLSVLGVSVSGSIVFFVVTNAACWYVGYPHTWAGLLSCYTLAIPFFQNTLAGDLFFTTVLFGSLALAQWRFPSLRVAAY